MAHKFSSTVQARFSAVNAGSLSDSTEGKLGFLPKTNILALYPSLLLNVFLEDVAQAVADSMEQPLSSIVFKIDIFKIPLCRSHVPFDQGLSAAVFMSSISRLVHMSVYDVLANSPPLSARNFLGLPK